MVEFMKSDNKFKIDITDNTPNNFSSRVAYTTNNCMD